MRDEMLTCSVDGFLEKLAPFSPDVRWIDSAYDHLKAKKLLGTPAETALPVVNNAQRRSTRISARVRADLEAAKDVEPEADAENTDTVEWEAYRYTEPTQMGGNEMETFKHLEEIVEALRACPDPEPNRRCKRKSNGYRYRDCSRQEMASEIQGANFKVDAVIANPGIYKRRNQGVALAAAQTAVAMEFKKDETAEKVYENRKQLVAAANHIMNDDPRRNWMYGITIENTHMSLWYFSRSYSMKSDPFDFTTEFKTFIRVFLSFLYAKDEELGHDPSIHRRWHDHKWCYVYKLETGNSPKYYRTTEPLCNPRSHCITGRKSRVWKVIEVAGPDKLVADPSKHEVVLKDCWADEGSPSEKEIQTSIFQRLKDVKEAEYDWAPPGLKEKLRVGLAHPETYFVKVELDWKEKLRVNKEKPGYMRAPALLTRPNASHNPNKSEVIASSQTSSRTAYSSSNPFNASRSGSDMGQSAPKRRDYKVKQHYRVVYSDVGESLAHATVFRDVVGAFKDIFIALTLLFLAGWVHRDVSAGNIILVRKGGDVRGKLSDLEYARDFSQQDRTVSADPKTGTPYFMPIEIHDEKPMLIPKPASVVPSLSMLRGSDVPAPAPQTISPLLKYNFIHDLESLWWIIVWTFLLRVAGAKPLNMFIFTADSAPHKDRWRFFTTGEKDLCYFMPDLLRGRRAHIYLTIYNNTIYRFYIMSDRDNITSYQTVYVALWEATEIFIENMHGVDVEFGFPSEHSHPASAVDPQGLGKRTRSIDGGSTADRRGSVEGPSEKKKPKPSEEDRAEDDTAQDMAGIARGDSHPRIRGTWN